MNEDEGGHEDADEVVEDDADGTMLMDWAALVVVVVVVVAAVVVA